MTPQRSARPIHTPQSSPLWPLVLLLAEIAIRVERDAATAGRPEAEVVESDGTEAANHLSHRNALAVRRSSAPVQS
jgi:hypothetical protein